MKKWYAVPIPERTGDGEWVYSADKIEEMVKRLKEWTDSAISHLHQNHVFSVDEYLAMIENELHFLNKDSSRKDDEKS